MIEAPTRLAVLSLLFLTGVVADDVTCYNCHGKDCEHGSCTGDYCFDMHTQSPTNTASWSRGCYNAVVGHASDPTAIDGFQCDSRILNYLNHSMCICQWDHCNNGAFHYDQSNEGKVTCDLGTEGDIRTTCTGDSCRFGQGELGLGCQYNKNGFADEQVFFPPPQFKGCYKVHTSDGKDKNEQCSCAEDDCNRVNPKATYARGKIDCEETETFSSEVKTCTGNTCFITGMKVQGINGFYRGCLMISGTEEMLPFCNSVQNNGANQVTSTCLCVDDHCNSDVDTAIASMMGKIHFV